MYNKIKVLLIAVAGVDKTRLIKNLAIKNKFQPNYPLTVGVDILTKEVEFRKGEFATLSIWDIKSQDRFEFIRSTFYKGSAGVILVFDLTRQETYSEVKGLLTEIRHCAGENIPFILVGDNVHLLKLRDKIIRNEAHNFANNEGGIYIETSPTSIDIIEGAIQ
ncbi:MAG: Rab family GTPase, partial [Promethearchaeota archaeon]